VVDSVAAGLSIESLEFKSPPGQIEFGSRLLLYMRPLTKATVMSMLIVER